MHSESIPPKRLAKLVGVASCGALAILEEHSGVIALIVKEYVKEIHLFIVLSIMNI